MGQPFFQISFQRIDGDAILQHRVAMADGHLLIFERLVIDRDAERRADFILPRIALSDIAAVVEQRAQPARGLQVAS